MSSNFRYSFLALLLAFAGEVSAQHQTRFFLSGGWFQPLTKEKTVFLSHHLMGATRPTWQICPLDVQYFFRRHIPVHLAVRYQQTNRWQQPFTDYFDLESPELHHNYVFDQQGALSALSVLLGTGYEFSANRNFFQINLLYGGSMIQNANAGVELKALGTHDLITYNYQASNESPRFRMTGEAGLRGGRELGKRVGLWAGVSAQFIKRNDSFGIQKRFQHSGLTSFSSVQYTDQEWALLFNAGLSYRLSATVSNTK